MMYKKAGSNQTQVIDQTSLYTMDGQTDRCKAIYALFFKVGHKTDKTEAITKCLPKKDMTPEDTLALNCYRTLLIHQIQPRLTFICSLNSNHTFLVASSETVHVVQECWGGGGGGPGAVVFHEGIAMHEHRSTKCIDVRGDYIEKSRTY